jgi:hypothetical protein
MQLYEELPYPSLAEGPSSMPPPPAYQEPLAVDYYGTLQNFPTPYSDSPYFS